MSEHQPLGVISEELDRLLVHIDARLDRTDEQTNRRFDEQGLRIDSLTLQVTTTNGSVRDLQKWRAYMEGVKAGAGGSWQVFLGLGGMLVGIGSLAVAIVVAGGF